MIKYKLKFGLPDYKDLLHYGEIIEDHEFSGNNEYVRVRKIRYMDILYNLKMVNGEVKTLIQWDSLPYDEDRSDIRIMDEDELTTMLMFADRDRKENLKAERVYWLCIEEINRRNSN